MPETTQDKQMLIQPNSITRAHYRLNIHQKHVILMMLGYLNTTIINRTQDGITFDLKDMHRLTGSKMRMDKYIKVVTKAIDTINNQPLYICGDDGKRSKYYWLAGNDDYPLDPNNNTVTLYLSSRIAELFSQLKGSYTQCLLKNVFLLKTSYAARLYELVMQYKPNYKKVPVITLDEIRLLLGIEDKYKTYNELQRFVVVPALTEINKLTDIDLTFTPERLGRFVNAIRFTYQFKSPEQEQEYIPTKRAARAAPKSTTSTAQLAAQFNADFAAKVA